MSRTLGRQTVRFTVVSSGYTCLDEYFILNLSLNIDIDKKECRSFPRDSSDIGLILFISEKFMSDSLRVHAIQVCFGRNPS